MKAAAGGDAVGATDRLVPPPATDGAAIGWRRRGETRALGFRLASRIIRTMPPALRYLLADVGGTGAYHLFSRRARFARQNYALFTATGDRRGASQLARTAFRRYAGTVLDFLILDRLLEELRSSGQIDLGPLEAVLEEGRGAIVVTPHFGNWDLGAAATGSGGRGVYAVADPFGPPAVDELVRRAREQAGVRIIPTGPASARECLRVLHRNQVLCLACDIDKAGTGVEVSFLGSRLLLPGGPAMLALRTGARIIPGYVRRLPAGRHEARLLAPLPMPSQGTNKERVAELTQAIASAFDQIIRPDPSQWFAFHSLSRPEVPR